MTLKKSQSSGPEADTLILGLGDCPSIGADRVTGAMGRDARRRAGRRCHSTSSALNKADRLLVVQPAGVCRLDNRRPPVTRREQALSGRISLSRAVNDGGHRRPSLSASSTHKTPVRDRTPILGQAPGPHNKLVNYPGSQRSFTAPQTGEEATKNVGAVFARRICWPGQQTGLG